MDLTRWPLALREELVSAFRPGEPSSREGPFRTLRQHDWTSSGISVVTRRGGHASGRLTVFSVLNVDAAICARCGEATTATLLAKAAARAEGSAPFVRLQELLSGFDPETVIAIAQGNVPADSPEIEESVRAIAHQTRALRCQRKVAKHAPGFVAGRISETHAQYVVLVSTEMSRLLVPRGLARAAHRENVGECLVVMTSQLAEREVLMRALPGIDLEPEATRKAFSPFGREAPVRRITESDARLLRGAPEPLSIRVPVAIEG